MHSLRFVPLTSPCKGSLLLTHVTFYLHFYVTSQRENEILVDHQSELLTVFHSVNFYSKSIDFNCVIFNRAEKMVAFVNSRHHFVLSEPNEKLF